MLGVVRFLAVAMIVASPGAWAVAQESTPITARSAVADLDNLKQTVEIPEFRIGGSYDLDTPDA